MNVSPFFSIHGVKKFIFLKNNFLYFDGSRLVCIEIAHEIVVRAILEIRNINYIYRYENWIIIFEPDKYSIFDIRLNLIISHPIPNYDLLDRHYYNKDSIAFCCLEKHENFYKWLIYNFKTMTFEGGHDFGFSTVCHMDLHTQTVVLLDRYTLIRTNYVSKESIWVIDLSIYLNDIKSLGTLNFINDYNTLIIHSVAYSYTFFVDISNGKLQYKLFGYVYIEKIENNLYLYIKGNTFYLFDVKSNTLRSLAELKRNLAPFHINKPRIIQQKYVMIPNLDNDLCFINFYTGEFEYFFYNKFKYKNKRIPMVYYCVDDMYLIQEKFLPEAKEFIFYMLDKVLK